MDLIDIERSSIDTSTVPAEESRSKVGLRRTKSTSQALAHHHNVGPAIPSLFLVKRLGFILANRNQHDCGSIMAKGW